ncbi:MFS transporter, partial [Streptomyces anulatus]|uniref:MFS transporter n=1 Tax=Streptomyces anulatus TaxID=1892 RepID=UPI00341741C3
MASMDNLVVTTALPTIRDRFNASLESLEWTVNAYTLTYAIFLLTAAILGDRFGRRQGVALRREEGPQLVAHRRRVLGLLAGLPPGTAH